MINGKVDEFVDNLYYGSEMYFTFRGNRYFIQGWYSDPMHYLVLDRDQESMDSIQGEHFNGYVWEYHSSDPKECVNAFLDAPLWDGKSFYDVEKEISWIDP